VVCPSSPLADDRKFHVPSDEELVQLQKSMTPAEYAAVLDRLSGSYGETLGYTDAGKVYRRPRNLHQADRVVFSDLPGEHAANSLNHGGRGQNVLYADGHVEHLSSAMTPGGDHIFLNRNGLVEPSDDRDDTVIVNAGYRP
jgi:prepilin-type processing-associated H-X9-DG protein